MFRGRWPILVLALTMPLDAAGHSPTSGRATAPEEASTQAPPDPAPAGARRLPTEGEVGRDAPIDALRRQVEAMSHDLAELRERLTVLEGQVSASLTALHIYAPPDTLEFAGRPVPRDRWDVAERLEREFLIALGDRGQVILWLKRSARYFPYIERELRQAGLPDDLKYVAVIESALLPTAFSRARALGVWQFIASTGRRYGLTITPWWDERRNPGRSTGAALAYLGDLYKRFQDWPLAIAAYNAGEQRIEEALTRQGVPSYYQLALPRETERYVFRVLAAKLILATPDRYGFHVPREQRYQPLKADLVEVTVQGRLLVQEIAEASGSFYRQVKTLNPEIVGDALRAGRYSIRIPEGRAAQFAARLPELEKRMAARAARQVRYRVRPGDTLSGIAQRFDVSVDALKRSNATARKSLIYPGETLVIPPRARRP